MKSDTWNRIARGRTIAMWAGFLLISTTLPWAGTPLQDAAAALEPGEWGELQTLGLHPLLQDSGASGHILPFSDGAVWDPASKQVFYIGGDHDGDSERFISYTDNNQNTWIREPHPYWMSGSVNQNHAYDYQAIDTENGHFYYREARFDIQQETWTEVTLDGLPHFHRGHSAWEYFPGKGLMAIGDGGAWILDEGASSWRTIAERWELAYTGKIATDPVAEYNPVHDVVIFGGGDGSNQLFKMDRDENLTALAPAPSEVSCGPWGTVLSVDPVTGHYLALDMNANFYQYDVVENTWTSISSQPIPHFADYILETKINNVVATPVSTYGVVLYIKFDYENNSTVWLYKHAPSEGVDPTEAPDPPTGVTVD